jgi:hypothetical protein
MFGEKSFGTFGHGHRFGGSRFWRHCSHPIRNIKARWRKHIPFNFTTKIWKRELELANLQEKAKLYEDRLNKVKNRIEYLETVAKKEAEKEI